MAAREAYARCSVINKEGIEVCAGLEMKPTDQWRYLRYELKGIVSYGVGMSERVMEPTGYWSDPYDYKGHAEVLEALIKEHWPDRAYFIEVGKEDDWVQLFQPYGVPRNA